MLKRKYYVNGSENLNDNVLLKFDFTLIIYSRNYSKNPCQKQAIFRHDFPNHVEKSLENIERGTD